MSLRLSHYLTNGGNPSQSTGHMSPAIWDHTVLPAIRQMLSECVPPYPQPARPNENNSVKFSVKKIDATILGHHIGSLHRTAGSAWAVVIYAIGCSVLFAVRPVTWIGDCQWTVYRSRRNGRLSWLRLPGNTPAGSWTRELTMSDTTTPPSRPVNLSGLL